MLSTGNGIYERTPIGNYLVVILPQIPANARCPQSCTGFSLPAKQTAIGGIWKMNNDAATGNLPVQTRSGNQTRRPDLVDHSNERQSEKLVHDQQAAIATPLLSRQGCRPVYGSRI